MYVTNARWTVAIDVATGKQIWRTPVDWPTRDAARRLLRRLQQGRRDLRRQGLPHDARRARRRARRRRPARRSGRPKVAEWKEGYSMTVAPLIANGVLITGMSGAEFGVRGFLDGWDPADRQAAVAPLHDPGPGEKGHETWPQDNVPASGGGSTWITGSYDPELDLVYWGTGNAGAVEPRRAARATTSTPRRSSRSGRRPARSSGITSSRRTTPTTSTPTGR